MTDLKSAFAAPDALKGTFHQGLALVAGFDEPQLQALLAWVRASGASGRKQDPTTFATDVGISLEHAAPVQMAVAMMVQTLSQSSVTLDQFIHAGLESSAYSEAQVPGLSKLANLLISARPELQEQANVARLQNTVLPTLTTFEMVLDARFQISKGTVVRSVPVVLAYADTDSEGQVIWFQMDEATIRGLRDDLSSMLDQIQTLKASLPIDI